MRALVPPLVLAARAGDVAGLLALIEQGHAVDGTDPGGVTPLIAAAAAGNGEVLRWLDAAGARHEAAALDGTTALDAAAARGHADATATLLATLPRSIRDGEFGRRALRLAAQAGNVASCVALVEAGVQPGALDGALLLLRLIELEGHRVDLVSPGRMASSLGRELADEQNEPEVYAVDAPPPLEVLPDSLRRLVRPARPGVLEAGVGSGLRLLIVVAPAPSAPPGAGPAFLPAGPPRSAALELHDELCEPRGGSRRRAAFAWASALALRDALVALEPRPDDVAELILHAATRAGTTASLEALLGAGCSPDARDDGGRTPLHLAAQANLADRVQLLLAAGASPDARDDAGRTALHLACGVAGASTEVLSALLDAGADVEARDSDGRTPVLVALVAADRLAVELLARGARADAVAADGSTALHVAAGSGRVREVLGHIVQSGAAPGARDAAGRTALVLALERGNHAIVPTLLRLGVPVDDRARAAAVLAGVSLPTPEAPSAGTAEPRPACRHGSPYDPTTGAYSCGWC